MALLNPVMRGGGQILPPTPTTTLADLANFMESLIPASPAAPGVRQAVFNPAHTGIITDGSPTVYLPLGYAAPPPVAGGDDYSDRASGIIPNFWKMEAQTNPDLQRIYAAWMKIAMASPEVALCRAAGFTVDIEASCALGYGSVFSPSNLIYGQAWTQSPKSMRNLFYVLNDWFTWGPMWIASNLKAYYFPAQGLEQLRKDVDSGRLKFKYLPMGFLTTYPGVAGSPDISLPLENRAGQMIGPCSICPTDTSLKMLLGQIPGPDGKKAFSPQTIATLMCCSAMGVREDKYESQTTLVTDSQLFFKSATDKWITISGTMTRIWIKAYGPFAQLDQAIAEFSAALRQWFGTIMTDLTILVTVTKIAIMFEEICVLVGAAILSQQPGFGYPVAALITASVKLLADAAEDKTINWQTVALAALVVVGQSDLGQEAQASAAETVGATQDQVEQGQQFVAAVPGAAQDVKNQGIQTAEQAAVNQAKSLIPTDALGESFNFDHGGTLVDIFGLNLDTSGAGLSSILSSVGDATGASDTLQGILDSIPQGASDVAQTVAANVNVAPAAAQRVPASPTPTQVASKPVAISKPGALAVGGGTLGLAAIAAFILLK